MPAAARAPYRPTTQSVRLPAPTGGMNTTAAGSAMPPDDCLYSYNLISGEYGTRTRLGYREWVTGVVGASGDNGVRSKLPFTGSRKNGTANRLFSVTRSGIYNASDTADAPAALVTFGIQSGEAGYGISCVCTTPGGRFLLFCDEENGLYAYRESTDTWARVLLGTTQEWAPTTSYAIGNHVTNGGEVYVCATPGVSASSGGPSGTGTAIGDGGGTLTWDYVSAVASGVIGPSLADQRLGYSGDPANFAFVTVWKGRVWLAEKDTSRAWYLDTNSVFGTATSFDFGSKMRAGGSLVGLWDWSYDAGGGLDTFLVGISTGGDVVIYQGTDPTDASAFGIKGTWFLGGVPSGRRIATDYGGDLLALSALGPLPLSRLVLGRSSDEVSQYTTAKIANLFSLLVSTYGSLPGWGMYIHPSENALIVTVPTVEGGPTVQLAMSFAKKAWGWYRDLPMLCAGVWEGTLYFGTPDGRVCKHEGYVDNVSRTDAASFQPVDYSILGAYQNLGNARFKRIHMLQPTVLSQSPNPVVEAKAVFDFSLAEPAPPSASATGQEGTWDNATWDSSVWSGDYSASQPIQGATGIGRDVAIAIRGKAVSRTVLVDVAVYFDVGGML